MDRDARDPVPQSGGQQAQVAVGKARAIEPEGLDPTIQLRARPRSFAPGGARSRAGGGTSAREDVDTVSLHQEQPPRT